VACAEPMCVGAGVGAGVGADVGVGVGVGEGGSKTCLSAACVCECVVDRCGKPFVGVALLWLLLAVV
jgi:hypothetical protein